MNFYTAIETTVKRAIVYAPFTAARAIGTVYSRFNPPLFTSVNPVRVGILLALLVVSSAFCWLPVASAQGTTPVSIPDTNLAAAVRARLLELTIINPGDTITQAHMRDARFRVLIVSRPASPMQEITALTGLEYATELRNLEIPSHNIRSLVPNISSLEPIKTMRFLLYLKLPGNENLGDISPIQGLTNLEELVLGNTGVSDLAPLANLTKLTWLDLKNNQIQDISALANLTKLTYLNLWNKADDDGIPPVPKGHNQVRDIGPLAKMTEMEYLYLDDNRIRDLTPLANMTKLRTLELAENRVIDISPLPFDRMTALQSLILSGNWGFFIPGLSDISPLARAPRSLTRLYLGQNDISDISPLAGLTALKWLELQENLIRDISPLTELISAVPEETGLRKTTGTDAGVLRIAYNSLNYASIYTHLPTLRAAIREAGFWFATLDRDNTDTRIPGRLVPISGDEQTGMFGVPLADPFVVETRDSATRNIYNQRVEGLPFAGVPLTFAITEGGGKLNPVPTETDDDGRAESTLTPVRTLGRHTVEVTVTHEETTLRTVFTANVLPSALAAPTLGDALPTTLEVSWPAPAYPVEGYEVRYRVKDSEEWTDAAHEGTGTSITLTDLIPGTTYEVQILAQTTVGPSPWSPSVSGMTGLAASTLGDALPTTLEVSWPAPAYPVEGYEVRYRVKDSEEWTDAAHEGTGTSITLTDLIPGTVYEWQVRARTRGGPGPWSAVNRGTTGYVLLQTRELAPSSVALDQLVFNELRNANDDKQDWLEVKNISDADMPLAGWEISIVASAGGAANQDVGIITFPDYTLPAGEVLLIVNTSPSETDLASGVNIATGVGKKGARHRYLVAADMKLPSTQYLLLLRSVTDKNGTAEALEDVAGNYFRETGDFLFGDGGTQVWPLQDTERPSPADAAPLAAGGAWARVLTDKRGYLAAAWSQRGYQAGLGYERGAAAATSLGTPGYANTAVTGEAPSGRVSISELMFAKKSGRRTVPQWLELYNNSMTEAVKLEGWRLEVEYLTGKSARRHRFDAVSLTPLTVLPNQTVLLVTWRAETSGHFPEGRVYNLYFEHPNAFNQRERRHEVLNPLGFSVRLLDASGTLVDSVGNLDGVARTKDAPAWEVPSSVTPEGTRVSLIRRYEDSAPLPGTEVDSWVSASAVKLAVSTYYGWETDLGTPGYRDGGPLPVALSQFQSVRTDAGVVVRWITESSLDNAGFNLLRGESRPGPFTQINRGLIAGAGTTGERQTYMFTDGAAKPGVSYYYRLEEVSFGGVRQVLATTRLRGDVRASGKLTTRWSELKSIPR